MSAERMVHDYSVTPDSEVIPLLVRAGRDAGLKIKSERLEWDDLARLEGAYPSLAQVDGDRWVILAGFKPTDGGGEVVLRDPKFPQLGFIFAGQEELSRRWTGTVVLAKPARRLNVDATGLWWFLPEMTRQWRLFRDVAIAVLTVHVLALAIPLMFQLVVDKVLSHQSQATLVVILIGAGIAVLFDVGLTFLYRYILLFATSRIDGRVACRTFAHLLSLPIDFFERSATGVVVKHMQQAEKIRQFLTGRLFMTLLEVTSLLVFVPMLLLYSAKLTAIVVAGGGAMMIVVGLLSRPYRRWLQSLYQAEGTRQALLVETIQGMTTVKSLAFEPERQRRWEDKTAASIDLHFRVGTLSASAQAITALIEKAVQIAIIGFGVQNVLDGVQTVGALIAFQMLAGRVSGPLAQVVGLVHEYQDTLLSARMLAQVMDQKPERPPQKVGTLPAIRGSLTFENVGFRYPNASTQALSDVSFNVKEGQVFAVVGRSGSGKSTLARLMLGFHTAQEGVIRLDGHDLREIDLLHLRSHVGVVLQENFLFSGTIRDNIAAARRGARDDEIMEAALAAGAMEFIERLPRGLATELEENGSNLSGGQRQRLAIARALVARPRLLIFDEATSALDPESEAIVRANMKKIAAGRTLVVISHRLSTLVDADAIVVIDRGRCVGLGQHSALLRDCAVYQQLWHQQNG